MKNKAEEAVREWVERHGIVTYEKLCDFFDVGGEPSPIELIWKAKKLPLCKRGAERREESVIV